jgi:hypothetical protein
MKTITEKNVRDIKVGTKLFDTSYNKERKVTAINGEYFNLGGIKEHVSDIIKYYKIK